MEILHWLLGCAIKFEYGEAPEKYNNPDNRHSGSGVTQQPAVTSSNPLDKLDFSTAEFRAGVDSLADKLQIMRHPDHLERLAALSRLVTERLGASPTYVRPQGEPVAVRENDKFGGDIGDQDVTEAARILRLLHIKDLRRLQTSINETIVTIQSMTANPRTDTRLGKVGR